MATTNTIPGSLEDYDSYIEAMRAEQYPMLKDAIYLDHAGTTLYSKKLMESFHTDMMANLFGNSHSASTSSQRSTSMIESVRVDLLRFFNAEPEHFDLVFTANATAAIKLVMEAFREQDDGFWYGYHVDSHTSLVGVREAAKEHWCFESDEDVERCVYSSGQRDGRPRLFAYPAQSNMNGRRLPTNWPPYIRDNAGHSPAYTLLDAAAFASTSPLDFSNVGAAPDFTVLSLYKIFGFPDLGALIVRKDAARLFERRRYFGGGTVDMVVSIKEQWHAPKSTSLHDRLEDGTLPTHSLLALKSALTVHKEHFGTMSPVSEHTSRLSKQLYDALSELKHGNGLHVCTIYKHPRSQYGDSVSQGPVIAFNMRDARGAWVSNTEVEKLANVKEIHLRTGGVCNPGGVAQSLRLAPWEMRDNFSTGHRCGGENDIFNGKPTGVIRVSLGAMSTTTDALRFLDFVRDFFVDETAGPSRAPSPMSLGDTPSRTFHVESLTVYPIKSCAGFSVPDGTQWEIRKEGLAWDREWCIVHLGTGKALSQKQHPRMALIRPKLDFKEGLLRIGAPDTTEHITVPLSQDPTCFDSADFTDRESSVCGDNIKTRLYTSSAISNFLTQALNIPCTLARFPASSPSSSRHSKPHLQQRHPTPLLLSNESPILTISRSSLNRLNETIKAKGGKAAHPSVFRANIVLAESPLLPPGQEEPWAEDRWSGMRVGGATLEFLGGCRRCQMVCIDQTTAEKNQEPFLTLARTRRFEGRVLFGVHTALVSDGSGRGIGVGDAVETFVVV